MSSDLLKTENKTARGEAPGDQSPERYRSLTVVTAADERYWRSLDLTLHSAQRKALPDQHRFVAYDLGLRPNRREFLERQYPWCEFRRFGFEDYPPHLALEQRTYAWKPVVVAEVFQEVNDLMLWVDSAIVFKTDLSQVARTIVGNGCYSLIGDAPLDERCAPELLDRLVVPPVHSSRRERVAGVLGLDRAHPGAQKLAAAWREHALDPACCTPRTYDPIHNPEQALLSILLFRLEAEGELVLNQAEIDIRSPAPVAWMSSRNFIPPWVPRWADPVVRAYYATDKAVARRLHARRRRFDNPPAK